MKCVVSACVVVLACAAWVPAALADDLRSLLDSSVSDGNPGRFADVIRNHQSPGDLAQIADWLKERIGSGEPPDRLILLATVLAWRQNKLDDALMYMSYYRALLLVDSVACDDPSSGGSLMEGSIFGFGKLTLDKSLTDDRKQAAVARALELEQATSSVRKRDATLCGAGISRYADELHSPLQPHADAANPPQQQTSLYAQDPAWRKKRADALPNLGEVLLMLLAGPKAPG